jgi:hypothetical protein
VLRRDLELWWNDSEMPYFSKTSESAIRRGRFAISFPELDHALSRPMVPLAIMILALVGALYSPNLGLSILYLNVLWVAYKIDRRHLDSLLITPLTALAIYWFYSLALGPAFLTVSAGGASPPELAIVQLAGLFEFAGFAAIYYFQCRRLSAVRMPSVDSPGSRYFYEALRSTAFWLVLFTLAGLLLRVYTGINDRAQFGQDARQEFEGNAGAAFLNTFYRFDLVGVMLVGLLIRGKSLVGRTLGFSVILVYVVFGFTSGTRGLILHPLIALLFGYYLFGGSAKIVKTVLLVGIIAGVPLISVMGIMRGSQSFFDSRAGDVSTRFEAAGDAVSSILSTDTTATLDLTGNALLGVSDQLVFRDTPAGIPFAGWEGFSAVESVFIPQFFRPGTGTLADEDDILSLYTGLQNAKGYALSFQADMYRRFGITGIIVGTGVAGWFFAAISAFVISLFHSRRKLYGLLMLMLMAEGYTFFPFGTLLRCFWLWFYDVPKHLIAMIALVMAVEALRPYARRAIASRRLSVSVPG